MSEFEIAVLDARLDDPQWPTHFDAAVRWLSQVRKMGARLILQAGDIQRWDWQAQAIHLSESATDRMLAVLPPDGELSEDVRRKREVSIEHVAAEAWQDWAIVKRVARNAASPEAVRMRQVLRDPRLLTALRSAGCLAYP
jgi:hypothetical protein